MFKVTLKFGEAECLDYVTRAARRRFNKAIAFFRVADKIKNDAGVRTPESMDALFEGETEVALSCIEKLTYKGESYAQDKLTSDLLSSLDEEDFETLIKYSRELLMPKEEDEDAKKKSSTEPERQS